MSKKRKYKIILYENQKRVKLFYQTVSLSAVRDKWLELKGEKVPPFTKEYGGKRGKKLFYELGLIYPDNRWAKSKTVFRRDDLGRTEEIELSDSKYRIKELIPYWAEEKIYDHENKKHIRYHELVEIFKSVADISQIFMLNNKIFLQVEESVRMFGNKNIDDAERLFDLLRTDLLKIKMTNFIFVKDISTQQRKSLYTLLEKKGYKRSELFRHYSY
jgi:outer membrane receptor for ferrienterochelin and colicin